MLSDVVAQNFCTAFYHALITGEFTVKDAFDIAFNVVKTNAPTSATTFLLLPEGERRVMKGFPVGFPSAVVGKYFIEDPGEDLPI